MRSPLLALAACVALFGGPAGVAGATAAAPPRAELQNFVCDQASSPLNRVVSVTAVMRPVTGTERMELRFVLQRHTPRRRGFQDLHGGDLGEWTLPPNPRLGQQPADVWQKSKPVVNLQSPAVYRFIVAFRWLAADRRVLAVTVRRGPECVER